MVFYPSVGIVKVPEIVIDTFEWFNARKQSSSSLVGLLEANIEVDLDFEDYDLMEEYEETSLIFCFPVLVRLKDLLRGWYDPL